MKVSPWVVGILLLPVIAVAQGEDAYPAAPEVSSLTRAFADPLPPPAEIEPVTKGRWWHHVIPSDRAIWLLSNMADIGQFSFQEVDTLETAHIKSGKGVREARLAVKMLVGVAEAGALTGELRKHRHTRRKKK